MPTIGKKERGGISDFFLQEGEKCMSLEKNPTTGQIIEQFGPTLEFLTSPEDVHNDFCVLRGVIPPGGVVPLHAHADTEDFFVISGKVEGLKQDGQGHEWIVGQAGDYIHVPASVPHAWRNVSSEPVICLIVTTKRLGHFFQEVGNEPQPVTPEKLERFAAISARYGHWLATPEENAAVGINMSF
jgi:quercetin dioxygenase-like cupin family protein